MPRSKKRKQHHDHPNIPGTSRVDKKSSAITFAVIFFGLLGLGIAYFAAEFSFWLILGAITGVVGGYFFGKQIDRSFSNK